MKCLVMLSGGIKSITALRLAADQYEQVVAVTIDTRKNNNEIVSASYFCREFQVAHKTIECQNTELLMDVAVKYARENNIDVVCTGMTRKNRLMFLNDFIISQIQYDRHLRSFMPFEFSDEFEIGITAHKMLGEDILKTWDCTHDGKGVLHCWQCRACIERKKILNYAETRRIMIDRLGEITERKEGEHGSIETSRNNERMENRTAVIRQVPAGIQASYKHRTARARILQRIVSGVRYIMGGRL